MRKAGWLAVVAALGMVIWWFRDDARRHVQDFRAALEAARGAWSGDGDAPPGGRPVPEAELDRDWPAVPELAGTVDIALGHPPAAVLGDGGPDSADDADLRPMVEAQRGAVYSPALSRAAREIAYQAAVLGAPPPEAAMSFLLGSAGAADTMAAQLFVRTNRGDERVLREAVASAVRSAAAAPGAGVLRVGVGEAAAEGHELERNVVVLTSWRAFAIDPTPRVVPPGADWVLRGELPPGFSEPTGNVLYPDNSLVSIPARVTGSRFELRVPAGDNEGLLRVGMSGLDRARGPRKLLQYQVTVGDGVPRSVRVVVPDPAMEAFAVDELAGAEAYAVDLINADRARNGLAALESDPELSAVARAHSEDMRDAGFFGHQSPRTGLVSDRLERARYRSTAHAENLARNDSIAEAQASLMDSVGHRRNLLDPTFVRVGVGLARADRAGEADGGKGEVEWHLTQVFARPVRPVSAAAGRASVVRQVNEARRRRGLPALGTDDELDHLAQQSAGLAAANRLSELRQRANRTAYQQLDRLAMITAHQVYDLETFAVPDSAFDERMTTLGVGVVQSDDDPAGRIGVVVIVAR